MLTKAIDESSSQKHAFSERKRRKRINSHYDSLRQLFPGLVKADKASVLTETVRRLKQLRNKVTDLVPPIDDGEGCSGSGSRPVFFFPGEFDELTVNYCGGDGKPSVRVSICCEDRPSLNRDLTKAIQLVRGRWVKAEMATVGGRTKAALVAELPEGGGEREEDVRLLRRALRAVVENRALGYTGLMGLKIPDLRWAGSGKEIVDGGLANGLILRTNSLF